MRGYGEERDARLLGRDTRFDSVALLSAERCDTITTVPLRQYAAASSAVLLPDSFAEVARLAPGRQLPASSWAAARTRAGSLLTRAGGALGGVAFAGGAGADRVARLPER